MLTTMAMMNRTMAMTMMISIRDREVPFMTTSMVFLRRPATNLELVSDGTEVVLADDTNSVFSPSLTTVFDGMVERSIIEKLLKVFSSSLIPSFSFPTLPFFSLSLPTLSLSLPLLM